MDIMYQSFLTFIKENELFGKRDRVLLAVSGGVDSMVLAHLMLRLGNPIGVAHINYHLRGEDSNSDQKLVEEWCENEEIPFHLHEVNPEEYKGEGSIQMIAREIRYTFFQKVLEDGLYDYVATAHNMNDSIETTILNMVKGSGIYGLSGIATKRGRIIRPLLFATKESVYGYAKAQDISWREDVSNQKNAYQRNKIRNEILPILREINPNLEQTMSTTLERLEGVSDILNERLEELKKNIQSEGEFVKIGLDWFGENKASRVLLYELIKSYGFNYADSGDLRKTILTANSGKVFASSTHLINLDRNQLFISRKSEASDEEWTIPPIMGNYKFGKKEIDLSLVSGHQFHIAEGAHVAYLDYDLLDFPLTVRPWNQGDYFQPLGMSGKKKVSDFLIDQKVPLLKKKEVFVLLSSQKIVWVMGLRLDDRYKVGNATKTMLRIELT